MKKVNTCWALLLLGYLGNQLLSHLVGDGLLLGQGQLSCWLGHSVQTLLSVHQRVEAVLHLLEQVQSLSLFGQLLISFGAGAHLGKLQWLVVLGGRLVAHLGQLQLLLARLGNWLLGNGGGLSKGLLRNFSFVLVGEVLVHNLLQLVWIQFLKGLENVGFDFFWVLGFGLDHGGFLLLSWLFLGLLLFGLLGLLFLVLFIQAFLESLGKSLKVSNTRSYFLELRLGNISSWLLLLGKAL